MVEVAENLLADPRTSFLGRLEAVVLVLLAFDVGCEVQMSRFAVLLQRSHYELFGLDSTGTRASFTQERISSWERPARLRRTHVRV